MPRPALLRARPGALALGLLGVTLLAAALATPLLPSRYRASSQATVAAPPARVWAEVTTPYRWQSWCPWLAPVRDLDTRAAGPQQGAGALLSWQSRAIGPGQLAFTAADTATRPWRLHYRLQQGRWPAAEGSLTLTPLPGGATQVRWQHGGPAPSLAARWLALMAPPLLADDLAQGLADLGRRAQLPPSP